MQLIPIQLVMGTTISQTLNELAEVNFEILWGFINHHLIEEFTKIKWLFTIPEYQPSFYRYLLLNVFMWLDTSPFISLSLSLFTHTHTHTHTHTSISYVPKLWIVKIKLKWDIIIWIWVVRYLTYIPYT